jgi:ketosteroid isomerase-like protein
MDGSLPVLEDPSTRRTDAHHGAPGAAVRSTTGAGRRQTGMDASACQGAITPVNCRHGGSCQPSTTPYDDITLVGTAATVTGGDLVAVPGVEDAMASIQSDVRALLDSQSEAIRIKDIDRLMSVYSQDIIYFDVVPPLRYAGSDALRRRFLQWFNGYEGSIGMEIRDLNILASGDIAVAYWLSRASGILKNGHEVGSWVRATSCCQRSNRRWLITHEHISLPVDFVSGSAAMDLVP